MRTKRYKTVKGLASQTSQLTAQQIINGHVYHKTQGWVDFRLDDKAIDQFFSELVDIIGGRNKTAVRRALRRSPRHWALERMTYSKRSGWSYCAGQDYVAELNQLRKYLYNL